MECCKSTLLMVLIVINWHMLEATHGKYAPAKACDPAKCVLPSCRCASSVPPANLKPADIPQLVLFTMDDGINPSNYAKYGQMFDGMKNPDGCSQRATFFVCGSGNNYQLTKQLMQKGHEIADHSLTHQTPIPWWKDATYNQLYDEIIKMRTNLRVLSGAQNVSGYRSPFLQTAGDTLYEVLADNNFKYDSSLPSHTNQMWWPYTLDHLTANSGYRCVVRPCPKNAYPGMWEVPLVPWTDDLGYPCSMIDACVRLQSETATGVYNMMMRNFNRHYKGNRSPFPIFGHSAYFDHPAYKYRYDGLKMFLKTIRSYKDVYFVSLSQAIEWTQKPTPLHLMKTQPPWTC